LTLTEAGTKRRAALYLAGGESALREHDPGGLEVLAANLEAFRAALAAENHTLKRALTDPGIFSGVGNAYSDEILHRARLSPVKQTRQLSAEEIARLFEATRATLLDWCERLRTEAGGEFPEGVTAFRARWAWGKPPGNPAAANVAAISSISPMNRHALRGLPFAADSARADSSGCEIFHSRTSDSSTPSAAASAHDASRSAALPLVHDAY